MAYLILEPKLFPEQSINLLERLGKVFLGSEAVKGHEGIIDTIFVRLGFYIDQPFMSKYPNCNFIVSPTTGINHISEQVQLSHEIIYLETDEPILSKIPATAEFTLALILSAVKRIDEILRGKPDYRNRDEFLSYDINDKKVLIIGMGRIGKKVAKYLDSMDAQVFYIDEKVIDNKYTPLSFNHPLLSEIDIVSVHMNFKKENQEILDKNFFMKLENLKLFVNTARGELISEVALRNFAFKNPECKIFLDVLSEEQKNQGKSRLRLSKNIKITPHVGGNSIDSRQKVESYIVQKYLRIKNAY